MSFSTMYAGKVNSPATSINESLTDSDTTITVTDASVLPDGPNLAVIGTGENAETILYTGKSSNDLTGCTRGFQGTAAAWPSGTQIARFFTEYDYGALKTNLEKVIENNMENLIEDGNFDYWLSAITATNPASLAYVHVLSQVKHYKASGTRANITISRQTITAGELAKSFYCNRCAADGADSSLDNSSYYVWIRRYIWQGTRKYGNGQKITVSSQAKSSVAGQKLGICVRQNYGSGGSPSSEENLTGGIKTLTISFAKYSQTFTTNSNVSKTFGTDNNDCLIIDIFVQAGSTVASSLFSGSAFGFTEVVNIDLTQLAVHVGEEAQEFRACDDEKKVLAIYEKNLLRVLQTIAGCQTSGQTEYMYIPFSERKIKTPTITVSDALGEANCISLSGVGNSYDVTTSENRDGFIINRDTAGGSYNWNFDWIADARYTDSPA